MQDIRQKIKKSIKEILLFLFQYEMPIESIQVESTKKEEHGDYTTNIALYMSKICKEKPMDLGKKILNEMEKKENIFKKIEIVNPGFINFFLEADGWGTLLNFKDDDEATLNKIHLKKLLKGYNIKSKLTLNEIESAQYVHSRICSIIKIFEEEGISVQGSQDTMNYEVDHFEKRMIKKIIDYPCVIKQAIACEKPDEMITYMLELSGLFYQFHERTFFRKLDKNRLSVTLNIIDHIRIMIKEILNNVEIDAPNKM
ncbi:DALR anticodon-binding domain-containing protein [Marinisporobacter balticus]|uniref:arginine--tRNA ligase n=1 Tax=Marinisporobacter balticus TaxID=2018667 RepID=A0A4R2LHD7_9FIRM|nr:DALR anticodon-binding domain-containing protein [Marinisporobacter balticus]TCO78745.1 DALR anticodon binding protein [Marinisporobacter balticus]